MIRFLDAVAWFLFGLAILIAVVLAVMFGILAGSAQGAIVFPVAIFSMAREGDVWGLFVVISLILSILWLGFRRWSLRSGKLN